jgi:two-component system C4-dicarboxylate transport sensor histidine kinase DctB
MRGLFIRRLAAICGFLVMVAGLSLGVWRYGYQQALDQLALQGEADLALASDRLLGQLERYRELAVLLAEHPEVAAISREAREGANNALFLEVADKTGALEVLFVDRDGVLRASAHTAPGRDLNAVDFVARAQQGALGWGHGDAAPLSRRAFYHAAPVFGGQGKVAGSVIVAADIAGIEDEWRGGFRPVFFTDRAGVVFVANRSELVGWRRPPDAPGLIPAAGAVPRFDSYARGEHEIWQMDWGPYLPRNALHLEQDLPVIGLVGEILMDVAPARRLALLQAAAVAALCLAFGALLYLATERRRALAQANEELEERVRRRTRALSETNAALRREAEEREQAQAALAQAQADLVQASKLSALGQMSAGISHELNQPLMAIRSFAENAVQFQARGAPDRVSENLTRISDMARRMGRIIQNLRAFSKQQVEPVTRVDLLRVIADAVEMIADRAAQMGVEIRQDLPPGEVWVKGGEVRLGQVFVNLMTNALDAMSQSEQRLLTVSLSTDEPLCIEIRDTGPGVSDPGKVFDPFYSTKEVGASEGMGLGLSISYGIVKSFGGDMRVRNGETGAVFIVELQPWEVSQAA